MRSSAWGAGLGRSTLIAGWDRARPFFLLQVMILRPKKKNPILRTRLPTLPPGTRSRIALGLTAAAALGRFELQQCRDCGTVQYPPREACQRCLSVKLAWKGQRSGGDLISETE